MTDTIISQRDLRLVGIVTHLVANTFCLLAFCPNMKKDDKCTMRACVVDIEEVGSHDTDMVMCMRI